jgi:hypothetical protein
VEELYRRGTVSADEYRELRLDVLGR